MEDEINRFLALKPSGGSPRLNASRILCGIALEHAESAKILIASRNFTSAVGLLRLQYEALVRAMWLRYAAPELAVQKLAAEFTHAAVKRADRQPTLSDMLIHIEGKAPTAAIDMLLEFKEYSWKPLNSFVHSGMHAINRHSNGYPTELLEQTLKASNGVSLMVGMLLVILSGDLTQNGKIPQVKAEFADCLPPPHGKYS